MNESLVKVITIGIPTKNRMYCIERVLDSVGSQTYPKTKIKIVFIDESTDGTYEKLLEWKEQHKKDYFDIEILRDITSNGYISVLRNVCIAHMIGDVMFFWDSDVFIKESTSLSRVVGLLHDDSVGASGLAYYNEYPLLYEKIAQSEKIIGGMGFTAIKKQVFDKVGFFNERLKVNEDTDIFARIKSHGLKVIFDSSKPGLHMRKNAVKPTFRINANDYKRHLKVSFNEIPFLYAEMMRGGAKWYLFKLIYYFILPILMVLWLINFFIPFVPVLASSVFVGLYVLANLAYHVWKASQKRLMGIIAFLMDTPCGIAISYGYLFKIRSSPKKST